jgi:hypothetical protein
LSGNLRAGPLFNGNLRAGPLFNGNLRAGPLFNGKNRAGPLFNGKNRAGRHLFRFQTFQLLLEFDKMRGFCHIFEREIANIMKNKKKLKQRTIHDTIALERTVHHHHHHLATVL